MTRRQQSAFIAGLMLGTAFFLIRVAAASTFGDVLLAVALTLAEFSVVWLLERKARRLEPEIESCAAHNKNVDQAEAMAEAERGDLARHERLIDDARSAITGIEREFDRDHMLGDLKALTTIAVNAVRSGYHAGISANAGEIGGVARPEEAA